eukprot:372675-Rhodomonas_salina.2
MDVRSGKDPLALPAEIAAAMTALPPQTAENRRNEQEIDLNRGEIGVNRGKFSKNRGKFRPGLSPRPGART